MEVVVVVVVVVVGAIINVSHSHVTTAIIASESQTQLRRRPAYLLPPGFTGPSYGVLAGVYCCDGLHTMCVVRPRPLRFQQPYLANP